MTHPLGANQEAVLAALEQRQDNGLSVVAAGRIIHTQRHGARHLEDFPPDEPCCEWCADDGRAVLTSLRRRRLVKRRRADGRWVLVDARPTSSAQTTEIPW